MKQVKTDWIPLSTPLKGETHLVSGQDLEIVIEDLSEYLQKCLLDVLQKVSIKHLTTEKK